MWVVLNIVTLVLFLDEPPALPPKPKQATPHDIGEYEKMGPGGVAPAPVIPVKAKKSMTEEERVGVAY